MLLQEKIQIITRTKIEDSRGWFLKLINGYEQSLPKYTGEIYATMALPGAMKGGHYHNKADEWFILLTGRCTLKVKDIETGQRLNFELDSSEPSTVFIPKRVAHSFYNTSESGQFILLAYSSELFDPADTILHSF